MPKSERPTDQETLVVPASQPKRHEAAKNRRESRMKAYERNKRQWLITKIAAGVIGLAIIVAIVLLIVNSVQDNNLNRVPDGVASYSNAADHDDAVDSWPEVPPTGGTHNNIAQKCQFYSAPINPGMGIHSMEHGAVWITYSPGLAQEQIKKLEDLADDPYVLVSPYSGLPSPIVASAWNKQLQLESADDVKLDQFIRVFKNSPDNTPEYGATCNTGSTDTVG